MKEEIIENTTIGYCDSSIITQSDSIYFASGSSNTATITTNLIKIKKEVIENIIDGKLELESLIISQDIEIYEIEEMAFMKGKTKLVCQKEIDLDYCEILKCKSELLLELLPIKGLETIVHYNYDYTLERIFNMGIFPIYASSNSINGNITYC